MGFRVDWVPEPGDFAMTYSRYVYLEGGNFDISRFADMFVFRVSNVIYRENQKFYDVVLESGDISFICPSYEVFPPVLNDWPDLTHVETYEEQRYEATIKAFKDEIKNKVQAEAEAKEEQEKDLYLRLKRKYEDGL